MRIDSYPATKTNIGFQAKTKIKAPERLLSKMQRDLFQKEGASIGNETDSIRFTFSNLHKSSVDNSEKYYTVKTRYCIETPRGKTRIHKNIEIPYEKNGKLVKQNSPAQHITDTYMGIFDLFLL